MAQERKFLKGFKKEDDSEPGLIQKEDDTVWLVQPDGSELPIAVGGSGNPVGPAGGALSGSYPSPDLADDAVTTVKIIDGAVTTNKLADSAVTQAKLADDAVTTEKISDGAVTADEIAAGTLTDVQVAAANKDGAAGTPSLRTLGTGATQATAGNDSRLSDSRTPTGSAGGVLSGTYPNPGFAVDMATQAELDAVAATIAGGVGIALDDFRVLMVSGVVTAYDTTGAVAFSGADLGAVLTSCIATLASAAGNPVGSIAIGAGTFPYTTNAKIPRVPASAGVAQPLDQGWLHIHGQGLATRIRNDFTSGSATATLFLFDRHADYDTFGHLTFSEMLWDANDCAGFYGFLGNYDGTSTTRQRTNIVGIRMYRIRGINAPTNSSAFSHIGMAWLGSYQPASAEGTANHIQDIRAEDCTMRDNGNWGWVIAGDVGAGGDANVLIDQVYLTRCEQKLFHALMNGDQAADAGTLTVKADPTMDDYGLFDPTERFNVPGRVNIIDSTGTLVHISYTGKTATTLTGCTGGTPGRTFYDGVCVGLPSSDNFLVGNVGHVGVLRMTDCSGGYSGDNSLEIDNASDVIVRGYDSENCFNLIIYVQNKSTPRINYAQQKLIFDGCRFRRTLVSLETRFFALGIGTNTRTIREVVLNDPQFWISQDRDFNTKGACVYTSGDEVNGPSYFDRFVIENPTVYWSTGGIATLSANTAPVMFWLYSSTPGAFMRIHGGSMFFDGAAPTLNTHTYRPIGVAVDGVDPYLDFDFNFRNDAGSSATVNTKGAVALGYQVATSPRGKIRVTCDSYTNDTAAHLISLPSNVTLDANHRLDIEAQAGALPTGGLAYYSATTANDAYVRIRNTTWANSGVNIPGPSSLTGLTTDVGKQVGTPYPVSAVFGAGSGSGISEVVYSTDGGTTYTPVFTNYPPIATPIQRGTSSGNSTTTTVFSPATTVAAGTVAILCIYSEQLKTASSVTDSVGGNTWHVDVIDATPRFTFVSCQVATPITSGDTITVTWSLSTNAHRDIWLFEVPSGLAASSVFDTSGVGNNAGSTAVSVGPTAALAQKHEIAFCMIPCFISSPTWTPGSGWTVATELGSKTECQWRIVSTKAAITSTGTWSASAGWAGMVATYKGAAATPSTMPAGGNVTVGPLTGDALIRSEFTTTQPTITLVPA